MQLDLSSKDDIFFVLTSFAHVILAVLFGVLLDVGRFPALPVLAFAITSKTFALSIGENERLLFRSRAGSILLLVGSLSFLLLLSPADMLTGIAVLLLYGTYPRVIRAKERAPLDVLSHGGRYFLLYLMGYGAGAPLTPAFWAGSVTVFALGVAGELIVGLRQTGSKWKNTAELLGVSRVRWIVNVLVFSCIILGSFIFAQTIVMPLALGGLRLPIPILVGTVAAAYLSRPVSNHHRAQVPFSVRRREITIIVLLSLIMIAVPFETRVQYAQAAPQPNYLATVRMAMVMGGSDPVDVQWLIFNYADANNFDYILLHTDGLLELSGYSDGAHMAYISSAQTGMSPYDAHDYSVKVVNGTVTVSLDGTTFISAKAPQKGSEVMISSFFPSRNLWVVSVSDFSVIAA